MRDIVDRIHVVSAVDAMPAKKLTFTGATIDRMSNDGGYESLALYLLAGTWTDGTFAFAINDSPDAAVWTLVTAVNEVPQPNTGFANISSVATAVPQKVGYIGGQRYVQVVCTVTGAPATGCQLDIVAILGDARVNPTTA